MGHILYTLITFTFISIFILGFYGVSVGGVDIFSTMSQISGPWPTISTSKCSFSAAGPTGNCNILDTVELGGIWILAAVGSVLYRVGALFYLGYQIFSILSGFSSTPWIGFGFGILMIILTIEFWKVFRSGHTS